MRVTKPQPFLSYKSFIITSLIIIIFIVVRLFFFYKEYQEFNSLPFFFTYGNVISITNKSAQKYPYTLAKIKSDNGLEFYLKTYEKIEVDIDRVRVEIFPNTDITFWGYLGSFFVNGKIKERLAPSFTSKDRVIEYIKKQHPPNMMQSIYPAMFFGTPLTKEIRDKVIVLGASHLIALSGFNLSILSALFFALIAIVYKPLQKRYFPYRYSLIDIGFLSLALLALYVYFTDFSPSLIRAYAMVLFGWVLLISGVELVSFSFLSIVALALLAIYPKFLVSISFWLSIAGVFYIMLIVHHTKEFNKYLVGWVFIPIGVFLLMEPIVHSFFAQASPYQLLSIPLEIIYVAFYPITLFLHAIGYGYIFDNYVIALLNFPPNTLRMSILPLFLSAIYVGFSIASIFSRALFYLLLLFSFGYSIYLFFII